MNSKNTEDTENKEREGMPGMLLGMCHGMVSGPGDEGEQKEKAEDDREQ